MRPCIQQAVLRQQGQRLNPIALTLSATDPTDRMLMSNKLYSQLLYITSAAVPGWTFFKGPAGRKALSLADISRHNNE